MIRLCWFISVLLLRRRRSVGARRWPQNSHLDVESRNRKLGVAEKSAIAKVRRRAK